MSSYRDDTQETAVAGDAVWGGLHAVTDELARGAAALFFGLMVWHLDAAVAADEVVDRRGQIVAEAATAGDLVQDALHASVLVKETRRAVDVTSGRLRVLHEDDATAADAVLDGLLSTIIEQATAADQVISVRHAVGLVTDQARAHDFTGQFTSSLVEDGATIGDTVLDKARVRVVVQESTAATDEVFGGGSAVQSPVSETAVAADVVLDQLHAVERLADEAVIEDAQPGGEVAFGQAWTANTDTFAMSRYAPYHFDELVVIDGRLHGVTDDGVYALDGEDETVVGEIKTGKLDLSGKELVHPTSAYLEYEIDDESTPPVAEMDVTTTQPGDSHTYTYLLAREPAGALTNGRFVFGRGLRGRHFSFALRLVGSRAYINDLSVLTAPTKRRV